MFTHVFLRISKTILSHDVEEGSDLSVKKLLYDYFSKEQIRDGLRKIGEPASRNKDRLARRLRDHRESHNHDIYKLLDFTDIDSLEMICHHYKLDATFKEKEVLKGKIEKANLLFLDKKPDAVIDKYHDPLVPKTKASKVDDSKSHSKKPKTKSKIHDRKSNSKRTKTKSKVNDNKSNQKKPKTSQRRVFSLKKLFSKLTQ